MADLAAALQRPDEGHAALEAVRELIERIEVRPAEPGKGLEIELVGAIAAMGGWGWERPGCSRTRRVVVCWRVR